jgi:hypothetical protein
MIATAQLLEHPRGFFLMRAFDNPRTEYGRGPDLDDLSKRRIARY